VLLVNIAFLLLFTPDPTLLLFRVWMESYFVVLLALELITPMLVIAIGAEKR